MSSSPPLGTEVILGIAGIGTTVVVVGLFLRATRFRKPPAQVVEEVKEQVGEAASEMGKTAGEGTVLDVEQARKTLKLLALEREALGAIMAKFFEAEDDKDISKEDRLRLSSGYESKLKVLDDRIKQIELVMYLNGLEKLREEIVRRYEATLSQTDDKIKKARADLKLEEPAEVEKKPLRERKPEELKEEDEEGEDEEKPKQRRPRVSEIDEKIEKLRQEVLKELEELEKLEIEI